MGAARIGKIRMKDGGAEVRVIHREPTNRDGVNWRGEIVRHARLVAGHSTKDSELIGFLVMGVFSDASTSTGFRWDKERCPVPRSLVPSWVEECVRREIVTGPEAEAVFDKKFEWRE